MGKKAIIAKVTQPLLQDQAVITGNRQKDLQTFRQLLSVDFGLQLLEHYVPGNTRLIDYCRKTRNIKYMTENLNAILYGNN